MTKIFLFSISCLFIGLAACSNHDKEENIQKMNIIIDTDANNELDDQHALAYAFCNSDYFNIEGITVNNTKVGDGIEGHYKEAVRIAKLFNAYGKIPIKKGATGSFAEIQENIHNPDFDGKQAVDFIIEKSKNYENEKLTVLAVGKLTNVALAIEKDPSIVDRIKLVWLGSNYPDPGEYNLNNDTTALNPVLQSGVETDIALVAYGRPDGTDAVKVSIKRIEEIMPGLGPEIDEPIEGRNGGYFTNFGDYAVNLWQNIDLYGDQETRSLFDLAALVILKYPDYAMKKELTVPTWENNSWKEGDDSSETIGLYYNFKSDSIISEFINSLKTCNLP